MNALRSALAELWGLFVEDATLTIGTLVCVAVAAFVIPRAAIPVQWRAPAFFILVAFVLLENVRRSARS